MRVHKNTDDRFPRFSLELDGSFFTDKTCFFATGQNLKFIVAFLNSQLGKYLCSQYVSILDDGGYLMQKIYLEKIPIIKIDNTFEIEKKIDKLLYDKTDENAETMIDNLVYEMYRLNKEEIQFIENR